MQFKTLVKKVKWALKNDAPTHAQKTLFEDFLTNPSVSASMQALVSEEVKTLERGWR